MSLINAFGSSNYRYGGEPCQVLPLEVPYSSNASAAFFGDRKGDNRSLSGRTLNLQAFPEQLLQAAIGVGQADAQFSNGLLPLVKTPLQRALFYAYAVIFNGYFRTVPQVEHPNPDRASLGTAKHAVPDSIFHQWLNGKRRNLQLKTVVRLPLHLNAVSKPLLLNVQISSHQLQFFPQRNQPFQVGEVEAGPQVIPKCKQQASHAVNVDFDKRGQRIQRIKQKMRLNLRLQPCRFQARLLARGPGDIRKRLYPRSQLVGVDRLNEVVVGPCAEARFNILRPVAGREQQNRQLGMGEKSTEVRATS